MCLESGQKEWDFAEGERERENQSGSLQRENQSGSLSAPDTAQKKNFTQLARKNRASDFFATDFSYMIKNFLKMLSSAFQHFFSRNLELAELESVLGFFLASQEKKLVMGSKDKPRTQV